MNREEMLNTAKSIVCTDRNDQYGEPEDSFSDIAGLWSRYLYDDDSEIGQEDVAIMMILLKIARLKEDYEKADSWIDIAGYAACGCEIATGRGMTTMEEALKREVR